MVFFLQLIIFTLKIMKKVQVCNPSYSGGRGRRIKIQGPPRLQGRFRASLGNVVGPDLKSSKRAGVT